MFLKKLLRKWRRIFNPMSPNKFTTSNDFSLYIEKIAKQDKSNYIDAIINYCDNHMLEPYEITNLINTSLKEKLINDYKQLNYITKEPTLNL